MEILNRKVISSRGLYDWDEWFDGQPRRATRGDDYDTDSRTFAKSVRSAAHRRGLTVQTKETEEWVEFQTKEPEDWSEEKIVSLAHNIINDELEGGLGNSDAELSEALSGIPITPTILNLMSLIKALREYAISLIAFPTNPTDQ